MLTSTQIKDVLGSSQTKPKVLTDSDKDKILEMCGEEYSLQEIVETLKETNDKVKKDHVKNFLQRRLKKMEQESK